METEGSRVGSGGGRTVSGRIKQRVKVKMMEKKRRNKRITGKQKKVMKAQIKLSSEVDTENMNPSEKKKARLVSRLNSFKDRTDSVKFTSELCAFLESNNRDLVSRVVKQLPREKIQELLVEAIDQQCFGSFARGTKAKFIQKTLSAIFMDLAKSTVEEDDPMRAKDIFKRSSVQSKRISKQKENEKVNISMANIVNKSTPSTYKKNIFDALSDSDGSDSSDDDEGEAVKPVKAENANSDDDYESVDEDEEMHE